MKELYITYTGHRQKYGKDVPSNPSRFLKEIPEDLIERISRFENEDPAKAERPRKHFFQIYSRCSKSEILGVRITTKMPALHFSPGSSDFLLIFNKGRL